MKKLFVFLAFFGCVAFTANAQSCSKTASKACCSKAATKLASADASIEAKTCSKTGKVTYYKNYTCSETGKLTSTEVKYDTATKKFVNVSPVQMAKENAAGGKNVKTVKAVKAVKTASAKKSCDPKSCDPAQCKKSAKTEKVSNAKLVKAEN